MFNQYTVLWVLVGFATGGLLAGFVFRMFWRERIAVLKERCEQYETMNQQMAIDLSTERDSRIKLETELQAERKTSAEKLQLIEKMEEHLKNIFGSLSSEALKNNTSHFLELANTVLEKYQIMAKGDIDQRKQAIENLVKPLAESLKRYEEQIREMEEKRSYAYGTLSEQVRSLDETQRRLKDETVKLVDALSKHHIRGYWGEIQLKRIVEYTGMLEYCDFTTQERVRSDEGVLRPDLIVRLPGRLHIVVDAKTPMDSYIESVDATDESQRKALLDSHARKVKEHINKLSSREYWKQFDHSPDFVVMFIPGEPFYLAALQQDPSLLLEGVENRVILASPTTLIALLRVVALIWRQEQLADNAKKISELGRDLFERIATLADHLAALGKNLTSSVSAFNRTIGTLESRVLVSARRFTSLGVESGKKIEEIEPVELRTRELQAPEKGQDS